MSEESKARSRSFFEGVYNRSSLDLIEGFVAADYVRYDPSVHGKQVGIETLRSFAAMYLGAVPDLHVSIDDQIAEVDQVVTRWTATGTHRGELMGIAPTGKRATVTGITIEREESGELGQLRYARSPPAAGSSSGHGSGAGVDLAGAPKEGDRMAVPSVGANQRYAYVAAGRARRLLRAIGGTRPVSWLSSRTLHHIDRVVFKITNGRHTFISPLTGLPIAMLTTTGARTGRRGTVPVLGIPDGQRLAVIASNYGQGHHPAWYHNLLADPRATVAFGGARKPVRARLATGEERRRLWAMGTEIYPAWNIYRQRAASREIGIFVLEDEASESVPPIAEPKR